MPELPQLLLLYYIGGRGGGNSMSVVYHLVTIRHSGITLQITTDYMVSYDKHYTTITWVYLIYISGDNFMYFK